MGLHKSQKGRLSAAQQLQEVGRKVAGKSKNSHIGRQQFGGVGSAHGTDRDVEQLSPKAAKAGLNQPYNTH